MKLQVTKREIEVTLVLTELEYRALAKLLGELSMNATDEIGLSPAESKTISNMYGVLSKGGI